ncbi:hypothetical protein BJP34_20275 [Moorena producens PAL-8-15-08-1]|uniref:Uncharacterized protein n=1 Tax=Moorena producens PAL-8-15-08-1 TaxID=1458985 RepID=A0A1D8TUZ4_9CYAN|nr:hypothetical protein BJP34_20275 [Moorena producens PAL-8-15-08-1]
MKPVAGSGEYPLNKERFLDLDHSEGADDESPPPVIDLRLGNSDDSPVDSDDAMEDSTDFKLNFSRLPFVPQNKIRPTVAKATIIASNSSSSRIGLRLG